jgi:hypothetical protein
MTLNVKIAYTNTRAVVIKETMADILTDLLRFFNLRYKLSLRILPPSIGYIGSILKRNKRTFTIIIVTKKSFGKTMAAKKEIAAKIKLLNGPAATTGIESFS